MREPLSSLLDQAVSAPLRPESSSFRGRGSKLTPRRLRKMLRNETVHLRLIDLFRKFDTDQSGDVDQREFVNAVVATLGRDRVLRTTFSTSSERPMRTVWEAVIS